MLTHTDILTTQGPKILTLDTDDSGGQGDSRIITTYTSVSLATASLMMVVTLNIPKQRSSIKLGRQNVGGSAATLTYSDDKRGT